MQGIACHGALSPTSCLCCIIYCVRVVCVSDQSFCSPLLTHVSVTTENTMLNILSDLAGGHLFVWSWQKASLPTSYESRNNWTSLDAIDVPLRQRSVSCCIHEASHHILLATAPDSHSRARGFSSSLPHAGNWLKVIPSTTLDLYLQTGNSDYVFSIGWVCIWRK